MSDFSLTLVLHFKTSKNFNGMAKVQIKSEKITPFGGIFHVREHFSRFVGPVIDKVLGLRCTSFGYQSARLWVLCRHDPCIITSVVARLSSDGEANCKISQHQYWLRILGNDSFSNDSLEEVVESVEFEFFIG